MKRLTWLLRIIGTLQILLGLGYLFAPAEFLSSMGHSIPATDIQYPLGMLAARFLAYGVALLIIARAPTTNVLWIDTMIGIQLIDLAVGLYYTAVGVVPLSLSGFPMFNAGWIILLLWWWRPKTGVVAHP